MPSASPSLSLSLSTLPTTVASDKKASQGEPTIRFTTVKKLFQAINHVSGDYLVVTGMKKFIYTFKILYTNY
jgi:hypothetical protein